MWSPQAITVRIATQGRPEEAAGAGWLCASNLIVTCAHVVNVALGHDEESSERPALTDEVVVRAPLAENPLATEQRWRVTEWRPPIRSKLGGYEGDIAFLAPVSEGFSEPPPLDGVKPPRDIQCDAFGFPAGLGEKGRSGSGKIGDLAGARYEIILTDPPQIKLGFSGAPVVIGRYIAGIVSSIAIDDNLAYLTTISALLLDRLHIRILPAIAAKFTYIRDLVLAIEERDTRKRSGDDLELRGAVMEDFTAIENFLREPPPQSYGVSNISPAEFLNSTVKQNKPVLLSAPGGSGKTHFLIDIALEAMEQGYAPFWLDLSKIKEEPAGQEPLSAERIFGFSVAGGMVTFKEALPEAIVIADGLNERSDFRERIATGLAQLRREYSTPTILGDRLIARGSRENFKPATLSPLSIDEIRKHVGSALAEGENWKRLLSSPFFLALYLKVRGADTVNTLTRNEMFRR